MHVCMLMFVCMCVHVCTDMLARVHIHVCVCADACVHAHVNIFLCVFVEARGMISDAISQMSFTLLLLRQGLSMGCNSTIRLDLLASELQGSPVSTSPVLSLQEHATMPGLFMWAWGLELRSSWLCSKMAYGKASPKSLCHILWALVSLQWWGYLYLPYGVVRSKIWAVREKWPAHSRQFPHSLCLLLLSENRRKHCVPGAYEGSGKVRKITSALKEQWGNRGGKGSRFLGGHGITSACTSAAVWSPAGSTSWRSTPSWPALEG